MPRSLVGPRFGLSLAVFVLLAAILFGLPAAAQDSPPPAPAPPEPLEATPFFTALSVRSVEASAAWYRKVFGFEVVRKMESPGSAPRIFLLRKPGALLELVEAEAAKAPADLEPPLERRFLLHGVFKVGFLVEDLDEAIRRLEALEVELRGKVFTEPDGSFRSLQVEDPDGNVVQVFERLRR
jgi:catechol 2,3-dioxygenase-like lactoylglutathione lyase family enzyme